MGRVSDTNESGRTSEVRVGQVWADNDKRSSRHVRVVHFEVRDHWRRLVTDPALQAHPTHARCMTVARNDGVQPWRDVGPAVSIRLDRFRPTANGYRLVDTAESEVDDG